MIIEIIPLMEGASNATLKAFIQDSSLDDKFLGERPAVIICPGGGYLGITEKETDPVALRFLCSGYHAFVLKYSVGSEMSRFPMPFIDAAKAVMLVRENARKWCIDSDKIILCGFSSGGHVAATLASTWHEEYLSEALNADNQLFRPNALILGYPLLDMHQFRIKNLKKNPEIQPMLDMIFGAVYGRISPEVQQINRWNPINRITAHMPPAFLWVSSEDALLDVQESLDFIKKLTANNIPYEFHIFEKGAHGVSLGDNNVGYSDEDMKEIGNTIKWVELALEWLKSH